jgi:hypothetical protein
LLQLFFPGQEVRLVMGAAYVVVAVAMIGASAQRRAMLLQLPAMVREAVNPSKARPDGSAGD